MSYLNKNVNFSFINLLEHLNIKKNESLYKNAINQLTLHTKSELYDFSNLVSSEPP